MVLVCEHKLGSALGNLQLERYLKLVIGEEARTGVPHRLVFVARDLVNVPQDILRDSHYLRPENRAHYRWQDIHTMLEELQGNQRMKSSAPARLRRQFIEHLRLLRLAAPKLPEGFVPYRPNNTPEEREILRKFGEQWATTYTWFDEKGYRCNIDSFIALYIWPTSHSEIPNQSGISHLLAEASMGIDMPRHAEFDPPVLEFNVHFEPEYKDLFNQLLTPKSFQLSYLNLPGSVQRLRQSTRRICISYAVPLNPLFETESFMDALLSVILEIYQTKLMPSLPFSK